GDLSVAAVKPGGAPPQGVDERLAVAGARVPNERGDGAAGVGKTPEPIVAVIGEGVACAGGVLDARQPVVTPRQGQVVEAGGVATRVARLGRAIEAPGEVGRVPGGILDRSDVALDGVGDGGQAAGWIDHPGRVPVKVEEGGDASLGSADAFEP